MRDLQRGQILRLMGLALVCVALQSPVPAQGQKTDVTEPAIQIIPSLTSEAVKNGETLGISVTLRAGAGVKSAAAVIEGIETIPLQPAVEAGGANADKSFGLWRAQWKAHGLEEKFYTVAIRVTDNAGRVAEDRSLFFSDPIAGIAVPGSPVYPSGGMRRVGRVILSDTNYSHLYCAVIDTNTGYALFTSAGAINPGRIIKVDLNGPLPVEVGATQAALGELNLIGGAYDPTTGYAYFGTTTVPGKVVKVRMEAGGLAPTYIGSITLSSGPPSENQTWGMVIDTTDADPANHYLYVACGTSPGIVVKVVPGIGAALPSRVAAVQLPAGINAIRRCAIDPANGYAYFATMSTNPAIIAKVALGAGASAPTYIGSATLLANESNIGSMVLDPANGYLYCGTYSLSIVPSRIIKVDVGAGASAPSRVAGITMAAGERELSTAVIDPAGGYAYFSCDHTHPARVYKIKLGAGAAAPSEAGVLQLATGTCGTACYPADGMNVTPPNDPVLYGDLYAQSSVIDVANGYAYFGMDEQPGSVVKVAISEKSAIKATRVNVPVAAAVNSASFYSHEATGNIRLAIYDDSASKTLLWESGAVANSATNAWITVPISAGAPAVLNLSTGTYWLAWQVDSTRDVPSYTAGAAGDGFYSEQLYASFSPSIAAPISTSEEWSMYITYNSGTPTPTPTPTLTPTASASPSSAPSSSASATPSPSPSRTATATSSPSPSPSPAPTTTASGTPSSTPSPTPSSGPTNSPTASATPSQTPTSSPSPSPSASPTLNSVRRWDSYQ